MKKTKAILMALCAVLLVAASVMGTLAYLTSTDQVINTFTVGKVDITLDEAPVDANGQKTNGPRRTSNEYHLLPGHRYDKDPIVHVAADSEDCYLFVKVENGIAAIEDPSNTIASQMAAKGWDVVDADKGIYVYGTVAAPTAVDAGTNVPVFDEFTISGDVTNEELAGHPVDPDYPDGELVPGYEGAKVVVTAYAVQKDGFENKDADYIWGETFGKPTTPAPDPTT